MSVIEFDNSKNSEPFPFKVEPDKQNFEQQLIEYLIKKHHFLTMCDTHEIYHYENGVYKRNGEMVIETESEKLWPAITTNRVKEIINHIKRRTSVERNQFDRFPDILNLKNCLYDTRTNTKCPHSPRFLSTVQNPIPYNPDSKCPKILDFLKSTIRSSDIKTAIALVALVLSRNTSFQVAGMLPGSGNNGKGVFMRLIQELVGRENTTAISLHQLEQDRFAASQLYGKSLNLAGDISQRYISDSSTFKAIVGNDTITAQRKNQPLFEFEPKLINIFAANKMPESADDSSGYYRRWLIIAFPNNFDGREDRNILDKITTAEELSGFLNLVIYMINWIEKIKTIPGMSSSVEQKRDAYLKNIDSVNSFCTECLGYMENNYVTKEDMYDAYVNYCHKENLMVERKDVFGRRLKSMNMFETRPTISNKRVYAWNNCSLELD